jgi:hypothetical protein
MNGHERSHKPAMTSDDSATASPMKSVVEEVDFLRGTLKEIVTAYTGRLEGEMTRVRAAASRSMNKKRLPAAQIRDARDMLTLLRKLDVKPSKGRRRDLKRVETVVEELKRFVDGW